MTVLVVYITGDDRFRQGDSNFVDLLLGMATVPSTHLLHTTDAKTSTLALGVANAVRSAEAKIGALAGQFQFAAQVA